jgi:hypothetical protein
MVLDDHGAGAARGYAASRDQAMADFMARWTG